MKKKFRMSTKLVISYVAIMLFLLLCIESVLYSQNKRRIVNDTKNTLVRVNDSVKTQMDSVVHALDQAEIQINTDGELLLRWTNYVQRLDDNSTRSLKKTMMDELRKNSMFRRLVIFDQTGRYCATGITNVDTADVKKRADDLLETYDFESAYTRIFVPDGADFWYSNNTAEVVSLIRPMLTEKGKFIFLEIDMKASYLDFFFEKTEYGEMDTENILLWGDKNEIFVSAYSGNELQYEELVDISKRYYRLQEKNNCMVAVGRSAYYDWRILTIMNKTYITHELNKILFSTSWIILLFMILGTGFFTAVLRYQLAPMGKLAQRMEELNLNERQQTQPIQPRDRETEILVQTYEKMIVRLQENVEQMNKMKDIQSSTLFSILQREIKPHFLYNTLGAIAYLCEERKNEDAVKACFDLSDILRYASNYATTNVEIKDEVQNLEAYLSIMKCRYRERLTYRLDCEEAAYLQTLPKLTLQPFVENAIKYSLLEQDEVIVDVRIRKAEATVGIEISDNGCGMDQKKIADIRQSYAFYANIERFDALCKSIQFGNLGLVGTLARLRILFGDGFSYEIDGCNENKGTTIKLYIED